MNGQLSEHPLAELIREIAAASLTGALRLERERVKVVVYFEEGKLVYATSNLRTHRLEEVLKRSGVLTQEQLAIDGAKTDSELAAALLSQGLLQRSDLENIRVQQVSDVLRPALLWTDGQWSYDARVRLAEGMRTQFESQLLLMEGARRLPRDFIVSRFKGMDETFSPFSGIDNGIKLLPAEAFLLSRVDGSMSINELKALSNPNAAEALCVAYTLALGGFLQRSNWSTALAASDSGQADASSDKLKTPASVSTAPSPPVKTAEEQAKAAKANEERQLMAMLTRMSEAQNHYEVLDVGREATTAEIKSAYHSLARSFHPDKFHKSASRKRHAQVEAAFARFAQAYETLANVSLRSAYDAKLGVEGTSARRPQAPGRSAVNTRPVPPPTNRDPGARAGPSDRSRAETRFQQGLAAVGQENFMLAVSCFAEAAQLAPDEARYRGHYGNALATQPQARRLAESELMAAIALDPGNASYHVMLARLYRELGFPRRAQTELERALTLEPGNEAARQLLSTLNQKE